MGIVVSTKCITVTVANYTCIKCIVWRAVSMTSVYNIMRYLNGCFLALFIEQIFGRLLDLSNQIRQTHTSPTSV